MGDRIGSADASNLVFDRPDRVNVMLLAGKLGVGGFVGSDGEIDLEAARRVIVTRIRRHPRATQRADTRRRRWRWVDTDIDPVRHVRLADPGTSLEHACEVLLVSPLDRDFPLWDVVLLPSVEHRVAGIVVRVHHAMADGIEAMSLIGLLADAAPEEDRDHRDLPRPARGVAAMWSAVRTWYGMMTGPRVPPTSLLGPVGGHHRVMFAETGLDAFHEGARAAGATVTEAMIAVIGGALAEVVRALGEDVPASLPVSVPVALRRSRSDANSVAGVVVQAPVAEPDVRERMGLVRTELSKSVARARHAGIGAPRGRLLARLFLSYVGRQRTIAVVTSSLRGPRSRLALGGSPLLSAWPIGPLGGNVRTSVAACSYAGVLSWGVHVDTSIPADVLVHGLRAGCRAVASVSPVEGDPLSAT